jgi:large subunit ribosomal protein L6e
MSCHTQLFIVARLDTMVKVTSIEQALKGTLSKGKTAPKKASKTPSFYPADDAKFPLKRAAVVKNQTKLRASITPGTILILLAGHFKGKRVIFLRQLDSGLLLVCGPYGVNGVPVKRVNQCYVIATSTKIDVAGVDTKKFDDKYFKKPSKDRSKKSETDFFEEKTEKKELPASYVADNKALDAAIAPKVAAVPHLAGFMATKFTLKSGDRPHEMKF